MEKALIKPGDVVSYKNDKYRVIGFHRSDGKLFIERLSDSDSLWIPLPESHRIGIPMTHVSGEIGFIPHDRVDEAEKSGEFTPGHQSEHKGQ